MKIARINEHGYLERKIHGSYREWWLVKYANSYCGAISAGTISVPEKYVGKRIRFRVEVLDDEWEPYQNERER